MLFGELNQVLINSMTEMQREANRDFTPTVSNIMHTVYDICACESGPGSFKRMKAAMSEHVERNRHHMFNEATMTVKRHLDAMCRSLQETMELRADEIYIKMKADYMQVLGGVQINQEAVMSREERAMRTAIMAKLRAVDPQFEPIAKGDIASADSAAVAEVEEPATPAADDDDDDDEESLAFQSVNEDTPAGPNEDSAMQHLVTQDNDDTGVKEPSRSADKKSNLPTPLSNEVSDGEL